jgi:hypothetical protein
MRTTLIIAAGVAALLTITAQAQAQANRTFVSGHGSDTNPCSAGAPCRSFSQAHSQTNAGGEITVLDSAGYGTVTINKAINIFAPDGVEAGVTTAGATAGITVAAGAGDVINLRGLVLTGGGVGTNGIAFVSGASLNIDHCTIRGFVSNGILMATSADNVPTNLTVTDTTAIADNTGFNVVPTAGPVRVALARVHATGNFTGIVIDFSSGTTPNRRNIAGIVDSLLDNNGTGISAAVGGSADVNLVMMDNTKLIFHAIHLNLTNFDYTNNVFSIARSTFMGPLSPPFYNGAFKSLGNNQTNFQTF